MCSEAYCLRNVDERPVCCFSFPKQLEQMSEADFNEDGDLTLITSRNDPLINSYNPVQLESQCGHAILYVEEDGHSICCKVYNQIRE